MKQILNKDYKVISATMDDGPEVLHLLRDVAYWLRTLGEKQWETVVRGEEDDEVLEAMKNNLVYIVRKENKLVGMFILFPEQTHWDEWLWGKREDAAVYLHKFALASAEIGNGLGKVLIQWIEDYLFQNNIAILRLDCIGSNEKLNLFYKNCGYIKVSQSKCFSLYEKNLTRKVIKNQSQ